LLAANLLDTHLSGGASRVRRSVMLIDDDDDARALVGVTLRSRGYDVVECFNGLHALEQLRTDEKPDLIVLDLLMPVMDGWEFRVQQKRDPALVDIPVLALSGDGSSKAAAIDADAYLAKPVSATAIAATVERLTLELDRHALEVQMAQVSRLSSLGTLAAGMAHEINNPLAYALLNLAVVERDVSRLLREAGHSSWRIEDEQRVTQAIERVRNGAERIRDIVQGLKTFARPELEARGPVDVLVPLESAIAMVAHEIRCRARLTKRFDGGLPPVLGNASQLGQVFVNLLLNAVQALSEDASHNEISVVATGGDQTVVVEVHDTGAGIPPNVRDRIFEPFFTTKPVGTGTGLGLAICHGIVKAHAGTISVDSEPAKGTRFRVTLPSIQRTQSVLG
jgi:signal transduction histidine kinase